MGKERIKPNLDIILISLANASAGFLNGSLDTNLSPLYMAPIAAGASSGVDNAVRRSIDKPIHPILDFLIYTGCYVTGYGAGKAYKFLTQGLPGSADFPDFSF